MSTGYLDNYYARLGIPLDATPEEVRSAYYKAARQLHPDTNEDPTSTELFLQIQEAYENLSDQKSALNTIRSFRQISILPLKYM